jgi:hypothetical protein
MISQRQEKPVSKERTPIDYSWKQGETVRFQIKNVSL